MERRNLGISLLIMVISLIYILCLSCPLFSQTDWVTYFYDDFEDGDADGWELWPGWEVESEDENFVLSGSGPMMQCPPYAFTGDLTWRNYSLKASIKIIEEAMQISYRHNENGAYYIPINVERIHLTKESISLTNAEINMNYDEWHSFEIVGNEDNLKIYFDETLLIDYTDPDPIRFGKISFQNCNGGHIHIDDVLVRGEQRPSLPPGCEWTKLNGPRGGIGYDLAIHPDDPDIVFVSDAFAGVHKSTDGGETWIAKNEGITARSGQTWDIVPVFSLTMDMNNPDVLWIGTQYQKGIFKSTNGGENWERKDNGVPDYYNPEFRSFSIDPNNSDVIYCGGNYSPDPFETIRVRGFIIKTTNSGENWNQILDTGALVRWIRIDPSNTNIIYASTGIFDRREVEREGILKSTDGGETWRNINNGITNFAAVPGLAMNPENPNILYACTGKSECYSDFPEDHIGSIYKTTNGGEEWIKVYDGLTRSRHDITTLNINPADPNVVYATTGAGNVFAKSIDGGKTWEETICGPPHDMVGQPIAIAVHPDEPERIYIDAYGGGVFKSNDGGDTWKDASRGYSGAEVFDIALLNNNDPSQIITATHNGVYISRDGGENWEPHNEPRAGKIPNSIAVHPLNQDEIILGDRYDWAIVKSDDGGRDWRYVLGPLCSGFEHNEQMCNKIVYASSDHRILYAGFSIGFHRIERPHGMGPGVYKSSDGGENWIEINTGLEGSLKNVMDLVVHPLNENVVYIGTADDGVFKTTNGGASWELKSNGLIATEVRALAMDPLDSDILYAGGGQGIGIHKTTNGGESWEEMNQGVVLKCPSYLLPIGRVELGGSFEKPEQFVRSAYSYSVPWTKISSIVIEPVNTQTIYAVDMHSGVYLSQDGGNYWRLINEGLTNRQIFNMVISNDGKILYASTNGGGTYRLTLKNYPPEILSTSPSNANTVSIVQGDSLAFQIIAYDLNADTLAYTWTLNGTLIEGAERSDYLLKTTDLPFGSYSLTTVVSDPDTSISITWNVDITDSSNLNEDDLSGIPKRFALHQNYPNPFNPVTTIKFDLPRRSLVKLQIYNMLGQQIETLLNEIRDAGRYLIDWDAEQFPSGIYLYRLEAADYGETRKLVLQK